MSNNSHFIPSVPPTNSHLEIDKKIILKENVTDELLKKMNEGGMKVILPDELSIKEKESKNSSSKK